MSGVQGHLVGHVLRRSLQTANDAFSGNVNPARIQHLQAQAELYENAFQEKGPQMDVHPGEAMLVMVVALAFVVMLTSIRYTLGEVVSTLAMIEQPQTTIVSETSITTPEKDDPDATIEKAPLVDEEIIVIKEDIITSSISKSVKHLNNVGGFRARWRGLGASLSYHFLHNAAVHLLSALFFPFGVIGMSLSFTLSTVLLARIHMTWTHVMISYPSDKAWFRRIPRGRKIIKTLALPSLVFALAQQATIALPVAVFTWYPVSSAMHEQQQFVLRALFALATLAMTAFCILLPAAVTLTRVEASLLPEDQETIVSFDRTLNGATTAAIMLEGVSEKKKLFVEAWRSFDRPSRLRLIKFYGKYFLVQVAIVMMGLFTLGSVIAALGFERMRLVATSGSAQLQLMAMHQ